MEGEILPTTMEIVESTISMQLPSLPCFLRRGCGGGGGGGGGGSSSLRQRRIQRAIKVQTKLPAGEGMVCGGGGGVPLHLDSGGFPSFSLETLG